MRLLRLVLGGYSINEIRYQLEEYLIPSQMSAKAFLTILEGAKLRPEQRFCLYTYRREGSGKMIYSGPEQTEIR
jgi:hypothetical protein